MCPQDAIFSRFARKRGFEREAVRKTKFFDSLKSFLSRERDFLFIREVFLNQLTRILNAARAGAPYIAVGYVLEVAAQIRAVLLLELLP